MRICVLMPSLDVFKGGNHLPLFRACSGDQFTIMTNSVRPKDASLPDNVRVITLNRRLGSYYYGFADWRFARAVLRRYPLTHPFWKEFDVLYLNQTLGPQLARLTQTGVPVLYAVHHPVTADRQVACAESAGIARWLWRAKYFFPVRWQRHLCQAIPHIMTVSQTVQQRLVQDYGISSGKIAIVPNGVDGQRFPFAGEITPEFDVIAIGSFLHPRKGFSYLLEVYRTLADQGFRIADVGKRSPEQRSILAHIKGITCFGTVGDEEVASLIRRSAVLISTSLYEGFGLSLIEALACGRPAIAFDGGAVPEVLSSIDPMLIVPLRDTPEAVRRILHFLTLSADERLAQAHRFRACALRLYLLEKSAETLHRVFTSLVQ